MIARRALCALLTLLPLAALCASCGPRIDLKQAVAMTDTSGGWYDAGVVDGLNKIVPMVTFRLQKNTDAEIGAVALNVVFRHPPAPGSTTADEWGEVYIQSAQFTEGSRTPPIVVRTENGYTGAPPQSRMDLLKNSHFRDVRAWVYAKYGSTQWVELGTVDVPRQLITR